MAPAERKLKTALTHLKKGNLSKAAAVAKAILRTSPGNPGALNLVAVAAMRCEDYAEASSWLTQAVSLNPRNSSLQFNLGLAHAKLERLDESIQHLRESIHLNPHFEPAQSLMCHVACQLFRLDEAIEAGQQAVKLVPTSYIAHTNLATAYEAWCDHDRAFEHYKKAAALAPRQVTVQFNLASAYLSAGKKNEAKQHLLNTLRLQPAHTGALRQLARLTRYSSPNHPDFKDYKRLLASTTLTENERSELYFSLGKMYQDCALFDDAFKYYLEGNKIEHRRHGFQIDDFIASTTRLIGFYTSARLKQHKDSGRPGQGPLFIVGMPRSGTSLIEQILASHPEIFGAGELSWFWRLEAIIADHLESGDNYPECTRTLDADKARSLSYKFLEHVKTISKHQKFTYLIDKTPGNFERLGLIWQLFPNARVIHCRRNPMDTCMSIFSLLFPGKILYGYDLSTLGTYYAHYERLMTHWETVMPEQILSVDYEELVSHQEVVSRTLINFLDLPWDDDCLHFYENKRRVRTASDFQVRNPIYSNSIGRWKHYESFLEPLKSGLKMHQNTLANNDSPTLTTKEKLYDENFTGCQCRAGNGNRISPGRLAYRRRHL